MRAIGLALGGAIVGVMIGGAAAGQTPAASAVRHTLTISEMRFLLNGDTFPYTCVSFFNAIYNKAFNRSPEERRRAIEMLTKYSSDTEREFLRCPRRFAKVSIDASTPNVDVVTSYNVKALYLVCLTILRRPSLGVRKFWASRWRTIG